MTKKKKQVDAPPSNEVLSELAEQLFAPGNWIQFPRHVLWIMSSNEALVLAYLMSLERACADSKHKPEAMEGWTYCMIERMEKEMQIPKSKQARMLNKLEELGILHRKLFGFPVKRYFKVDRSRLVSLICEQLSKKGNG